MATTEIIYLKCTVDYESRYKQKTGSLVRISQSELSAFNARSIRHSDPNLDTQASSASEDEALILASPGKDTQSTHIVNSPYLGIEHQLDLTSLDIQSQLLAHALTVLSSATSSFATAAYQDSLNWSDVFHMLRGLSSARSHHFTEQIFYVVEFRSQLKNGIDRPLLFKLDKESHREATASGGLLKYWFVSHLDNITTFCNASPILGFILERTCLTYITGLWRSKADAVLGGKGPWHKRARGMTAQMYEKIDIKGLRLTIEEDASDWRFEPWV